MWPQILSFKTHPNHLPDLRHPILHPAGEGFLLRGMHSTCNTLLRLPHNRSRGISIMTNRTPWKVPTYQETDAILTEATKRTLHLLKSLPTNNYPEDTTFELCPFCGSRAAKVYSHEIKTPFKNGLGERIKHTKYYTRCNICHARGPLANSKNLAREFWNYTKFDPITKSWHYDSLRYQS